MRVVSVGGKPAAIFVDDASQGIHEGRVLRQILLRCPVRVRHRAQVVVRILCIGVHIAVWRCHRGDVAVTVVSKAHHMAEWAGHAAHVGQVGIVANRS